VSGWEQRARAMARQIAYLPSRWMRPGEVGSREGEDGPSDEAAWVGSGYDRAPDAGDPGRDSARWAWH
jgi:hypothetical protein